MLMVVIMVKPIYWPMMILMGVRLLLVDDSAKKVTRTNMSSILVMANELHAVAIDFAKSMKKTQQR
jgi:hypothetical protein